MFSFLSMEGYAVLDFALQSEFYENSFIKPPEELKSGGGRGKYCCIPNCGNASRDRDGKNTGIALFTFPNEKRKPELRKKWKQWLVNHRRASGADQFKITSVTYICEFHFPIFDIKISMNGHIKTLKADVVPSIIKVKEKTQKPARKPPKIRESLTNNVSSYDDNENIEPQVDDVLEEDEFSCESDFVDCENCDNFVIQLSFYREMSITLSQENDLLKEEVDRLSKKIYSYNSIRKNEEMFRHTTGLEPEKFQALYEYLDPGDNCENIKMYNSSNKDSSANVDTDGLSSPSFMSPGSKPGPRPKLDAIEQLFLFLTWLRLGLTLKYTGWLFGITKSTASRYIITWANFMYFKLGCIPIWPTKQQVRNSMPQCFKDTYPKTRVVIDCTELFCQRPSSLTIQSSLFSFYKHHVTYKGLVGISPSGAITFVSELYDGSISDVEIVRRCGFLEKKLWEEGDDVMADRGFTIQDLLAPLNVTLNIPSFLAGKDQLSEDEALESQTIAAVRIHVERAIERIKRFRQIRNEIPLTLNGSINQIWTVTCLLCNFMPPLIKQSS